MTREFHLLAVVVNGQRSKLLRIPLHSSQKQDMMKNWDLEYVSFIQDFQQIEYRAGHNLKNQQCFRFIDFELPQWIAEQTIETIATVAEIGADNETFNRIQGTVAFTRNYNNEEVLLFQDFARSNVISPGRFLQFADTSYRLTEHSGFLLKQKLSAVYHPSDRKLLFRDFRGVNSFLPIFEFYKKVSEQEIRDLLTNSLFLTEDPDAWAKGASHWFRVRLLRLRESGLLDRFSAQEIKARSDGFDIPIELVGDRIVFPTDSDSAKELLVFLNEEYFKGPLTDTIYRTNHKTRNDAK